MPTSTRSLTLAEATKRIRERAFVSRTGERVGLECEWITRARDGSRPPVADLRALLADLEPLAGGSRLSFEPGGQVEVSTAPASSVDEACRLAAADGAAVRERLAECGIDSVGIGLDPERPPVLLTSEPRYVAMKRYFDGLGAEGAHMMCGTAALQVNLDAGADEAGRRRWALAHRMGPTLVAAFANSPVWGGRPTGWKSTRMANWFRIDATRTAPAGNGALDPSADWCDYALRANVMLVRLPGRFEALGSSMPFADWVMDGHALGFPTADDLDYHLTTLFPPVVPRGWLELRMIDMLPDPWWRVAATVTCTALVDPETSAAVWEATEDADGLWVEAARSGLEHPVLSRSARGLFRAVLEAGSEAEELVAAYAERYIDRGRCPADDLLDAPDRRPYHMDAPDRRPYQMDAEPKEIAWGPSTT